MSKQDIIDEIHSLEDTLTACGERIVELRKQLHEIECDEAKERNQAFRQDIEKNGFANQPLLPKDWTHEDYMEVSDYLDTVAQAYGIKREKELAPRFLLFRRRLITSRKKSKNHSDQAQ